MELYYSLKNSLRLPKKEALFRLNRVSMRNAISYIVVLLFLLFLPELILMMIHFQGEAEGLPKDMYILQLIVFYPFWIVFLAIAGVSVLAAVSVLIKNLLHRKLAYQQLWKMTAFALTIPLLVYILLDLLPLHPFIIHGIPLGGLYYLIWKMIEAFPKRRR